MVIYVDVMMVQFKCLIVRHRKVNFSTDLFRSTNSLSSDPCVTMPCGPQGRCLPLNAAPKGYMCMCQAEGVSYTTIDTCPTTSTFCTHMTCKNGGTCVPFSLNEPSCNIGQISSTCCQCKQTTATNWRWLRRVICFRSTGFYWFTLWTRFVDCLK